MNSCIYQGSVSHRRLAPHPHSFRYGVFLLYMDLSELNELFDGRWLWSTRRVAPARFCREDYLGDPRVPLEDSVRSLVQERLGRVPSGPIRLLAHPRYFGYCFNPVAFYYCFDRADRSVEVIIAEITNTPWGERYAYVLDAEMSQGRGNRKRFRFPKNFHVSPFLPMEMDYRWTLSDPGRFLSIHMENFQGEAKTFDATMTLKRREISTRTLTRVLLNHPWMTGKVIAAIYWNALLIRLKRNPYFPHPATLDSEKLRT